MSVPSELPDMRIMEWLGTDSKHVPYYLHPLNLVWSDEGVEHDLELYHRVAALLTAEPAYWSQLIRADSWRHNLPGCVCLLASRRRDFFDDLCFRFEAGSWVAPQIAVTLGLLYGADARRYFESALGNQAIRSSAKKAISADRVLTQLSAQAANKVSVHEWPEPYLDDAMIADVIVPKWWSFWSARM